MTVGIVGASGHWAYALNELKNHSVAGVCAGFEGEDVSGVKKTLEQNGISCEIVEDAEALFDKRVDIMIVNTRFDLNITYVKRCLERGIYVFAEKPLALDTAELESLPENAFVSCMFGISYSGWCLTLKEAVKDIGNIRLINGRKSYKIGTRPEFYKHRETFGGLIPWVSIHAIHWISFVTGLRFTEVTSQVSSLDNFGNGDLETVASSTFLLDNGAIATVTSDYYRPMSASTWDDDRLRIVGTKGILEYERGEVRIIDESGERTLPILPDEDIFKLFVERVNGKDAGVSMEESVYITKVALLAQRSAQTGSTVRISR